MHLRRQVKHTVHEPVRVLEALQITDPFSSHGGDVDPGNREELVERRIRCGELDADDGCAAPFHFHGDVAARRPDLEHALAGEIDATQVLVDSRSEVPFPVDGAVLR